MSDETPKFEIVDRRKMKAQEEQESTGSQETKAPAPKTEQPGGPRLVEKENKREQTARQVSVAQEATDASEREPGMPAAPTAEESHEQKKAYDASAQRLEDMVRAQNPAAGPQPPITFETLVQQFYVTALIQMGAGTQEGQRPQVDIMGAKNTIDLLGLLAEKTRGNLSKGEDHMLQTALYDTRMMFLEITGMISMPTMPPAPKK